MSWCEASTTLTDPGQTEAVLGCYSKHWRKHTLFLRDNTDVTTLHRRQRCKESQWTRAGHLHWTPTPLLPRNVPHAAGQSMQARRCTKRLSKVCPESRDTGHPSLKSTLNIDTA
ncbi:hypothetical protein E2C01_004932 [Portunus trituberculatus]|uniref:Uncharacterized protein n=1 Tax=Portunus trituberculatus TaxID=210409 RepID=A0A5B7CRB0_PORTR|nr:hypothetical protein [Portunus trituberculatus]